MAHDATDTLAKVAPAERLRLRLDDVVRARELVERLNTISSIRERMSRKWTPRIVIGAGRHCSELELSPEFSERLLCELESSATAYLRAMGVDA